MSYDELESQINDAMNPAEDTPAAEPDAPVEVESGADDGAAAEPAAAEPEAILGKFKSQDDLVKAYQELERQFTQERQQQPAAEPEPEPEYVEPFNPLAQFAIGFDDADRQQIATSTYASPQETLEWAMSDEIAKWQPDLQHQVFQLWQSFAPIDAQRYIAKSSVQAEREQVEALRGEWQQEQAQKAQAVQAQAVQSAVGKIRQTFSDFDGYKDRVVELIVQNAIRDDDPRFSDPDQMLDYVKTLYARAKYEEFERQGALAGEVAPTTTPPAGAKARTQTRSTAAPNDGNIDEFGQSLLEQMKALTG